MNIKLLVSLADRLDAKGLISEANMIDKIIMASEEKNTREQIERLQSDKIMYIEIPSADYSCGNCKFLNKESLCVQKDIDAYVSTKKGSCNLFLPVNEEVIDPKDWAKKTIKEAKDNKHKNTEEQIKRLQNVAYIEVPEGKFSCGNCMSMDGDNFTCINKAVQAHIAERGCCNLFWPADDKVIPSEKWAQS